MLELILGVLLAAGATYYVLLPILRPPLEPQAAPERSTPDEGDDPEDDLSPQTVALRALKEIEFDRATGKLSDADYDQLKARYTERALAAMRETGHEKRETGNVALPGSTFPVSRFPCPDHGSRPESDALFCSACGRRLQAAPGFCSRCGATLENDARYCNRCGARVAA